MAKRTINRRELREQAEAAEKRGVAEPGEAVVGDKKKAKEPKKKAAPRPKRVKTKVIIRKRLIWGVFSGTMKEEGRFAYAEKEAAEARAAELSAKHKKTFFVQPIKEALGDKPVETEEDEE
jgi:hypothetical protein